MRVFSTITFTWEKYRWQCKLFDEHLTTNVNNSNRAGFRKYTSGPGNRILVVRCLAIAPPCATDVILYFRVIKPPRMANVREPVWPIISALFWIMVPCAPFYSQSVCFSSKLVCSKVHNMGWSEYFLGSRIIQPHGIGPYAYQINFLSVYWTVVISKNRLMSFTIR